MPTRGKHANAEEWQEHIIHVAADISGRLYSRWHFENYPQEANRIYEDWLLQSGLPLRRDKTAVDLAKERTLLAAQRQNWNDLVKIKNRPLEFLKGIIRQEGPLIIFSEDQLWSMGKRLVKARDGLQDVEGFFEMLT